MYDATLFVHSSAPGDAATADLRGVGAIINDDSRAAVLALMPIE
jgi:hypothetical protein